MKSKLIRKRAWIVAAVFVLLAFCGAEVAHRTIVAPKHEALQAAEKEAPIPTFDGMYMLSLVSENGNPSFTLAGYNGEDFYFETATVPAENSEIPVESIGYCAFADCFNLKTLTLPVGLKRIEKEAVVRCEDLTDVYIPATVKSIDTLAFEDCGKFTVHAEPGSYAEQFAKDNGIPVEEYTPKPEPEVLGDTIKVVLDKNFRQEIFSATYSTVLYEGEPVCAVIRADFGTVALKEPAVIPSEIDGVPVTILSTQALGLQIPIYDLVLPDSLKIVGDRAFANMGNLKSVTMGNSVTYIGDDAFYGCRPDVVIKAPADSYAAQYAKENGMTFEAVE